jgi:hypothetical protein
VEETATEDAIIPYPNRAREEDVPAPNASGALRIDPVVTFGLLLIANAVLTVADLLTLAFDGTLASEQLRRVFDVDEEQSVPTWFSTIQLFIAALLVAAIGWISRVERRRHAGYWLALAVLFLALSMDEAAGFHEAGAMAMDRIGLAGPWVILGALFVSIVAVVFVPFVRALPARFAVLFCLAGCLTLSGALIVETIELQGLHESLALDERLLPATEEVLERLGISVFIFALLLYIKEYLGVRGVGLSRATRY